MRKRNYRTGLLLALPSLIGVFSFYVIPFLSSLYYTFTQGVSAPEFVGLQNFRDLAANTVFRQAVRNTSVFLVIGVPLVLLLAILFSVILVKGRFTWQRWALLLPFVLPASSMAIAWQSIWGAGGAIGTLLGLPETDFLSGGGAFPLLLLLYLLRNMGYISIILMSAIRGLPPEYQESYRLDSNSEMGYIVHVVMPLISPSLLFAGIVAVMNYFLLFRDIYMIYQNAPPPQIYMLQHFMNNNFYKLNYQRLSAAAFLAVLCLSAFVVLILLLQRRVKSHVE